MLSAELKKIIVEQRQEVEDFFRTEHVIEREVDADSLKHLLSRPNALVITGVRRSGKSTFAHLLLRESSYASITFDDERLVEFTSRDFDTLLSALYELYGSDIAFFLFDEIQNIPHWELFVTRLRRTKRVVITGSNAKLLSGELATHLTGRYTDLTLYPFSFREFLRFKHVSPKTNDGVYTTAEVSKFRKNLDEYLAKGGFPEAHTRGTQMIRKLYGDVLDKDILLRHRVRHGKTLKELAKYLLSNFGNEMTYAKLKNTFLIKNVHTVKNYTDYLTSSFLLFLVERFSYQLKEQAIAPKKIYGIDTGLLQVMSFQNSPNRGKLMENAVFLELARRASSSRDPQEIHYWKDHRGREVDFVLKRGTRVTELIQVCESLQDSSVRDREFASFATAIKELRCQNPLVITSDEEGEETYKGEKIKFVPLWKWLLER